MHAHFADVALATYNRALRDFVIFGLLQAVKIRPNAAARDGQALNAQLTSGFRVGSGNQC
jgi:hypothetical protein